MLLEDWSSSRREAVDATLGDLFPDAWPSSFREAVRYPLFTGGKRVRPLLCVAAYEAVQSRDTDPDLRPALAPAAAVELIHTYSLVHDDLPALDDDDERRGRPTVHIAYGEPAAILVGDALLTEAFGVLARSVVAPEIRVSLIARLANAAGHLGMIGGQAADVGLGGAVDDVDALTRMHAGKTGALIQASVAMGGLVGRATAEQQEQLEIYGRAVGLAFQLADDVLDADEDAGDDGPPSYVKLLGVDETRRRAESLRDDAIAAAQRLPSPGILVDLARFIVARDI